MRKVAGLLGLSLCLGLAPHAASAAGFDGRWIADIPSQDRCNAVSIMTLVVSGDAISGEIQNPGNRHPITGKTNPDGTATFAVDHRWTGTMSFHGDRFEATWNNGSCDRHAEGGREPDDAQRAALAAQRKQHQAAYADLIRRAEAGDKTVDFNQLRAEAVYAKDWEFYDGKAAGLLTQASVAVKGKDCDQALSVLNQVIKLDFTLDAAHALRAECLKQTGKADQARIEDGIAKGLIHSLMDSGKGDSEKTAYVVQTYREEMDVLANRHIQIKTRETQVRGSDGRYYDVIHGISVTGGLTVDARIKDVYFDMTSFATGRASRRAAAQELASQLQ
jgi:hypothetical protein